MGYREGGVREEGGGWRGWSPMEGRWGRGQSYEDNTRVSP